MRKKLQWNAVGIKKHIDYFLEKLLSKRENIPRGHTVSFRRLTGFIDHLNQIKDTIKNIDEETIPKLESIFRINFKTPELVYLALSRPSIKNIFTDIEIEFSNDEDFDVPASDMKDLKSSGDAGNVLALIGDAVLDLAVVNVLWDSSLSKIGDLTIRRSNLVANKNLAKFADKINLYDQRLRNYFDPSDDNIQERTLIHEKGTLVEAIIGVIYMESDLEEIERIIPMLK